METITPLLQLNPGEVLINFMTGHIRRFLDSPRELTQESFKKLFGSSEFRDKIQGLAREDRDDAAVFEYAARARSVGKFDFACSAIVLHPEFARTHFNLIYLTRNSKGVQVFKEAEKKAMELQEHARADAQQRRRVAQKGQCELFASQQVHDYSHYAGLRERYLSKARTAIIDAMKSKRQLLYDEAWKMALSEPMSWESDLKQWIQEWKQQGLIDVIGMGSKQRVPHRNEGNLLIWKSPS